MRLRKIFSAPAFTRCGRLGGETLVLLAVAGALSAQVAGQANSGYKTPEQRQGVATTLGNPERDQQQKPGQLVHDMGVQKGMTVADVGTGIGYMLPFLSRAVGPDGHVIAEDLFDDFLAAARDRAENQKLTNVAFVKGTETDPNLPEGQMDEVLVLDAYHHFDYPEKMLAAIHKSLKDGGKLVVVRLDMPDAIKEIEANHFHLVMEKETIRNSQYMLVLEKS